MNERRRAGQEMLAMKTSGTFPGVQEPENNNVMRRIFPKYARGTNAKAKPLQKHRRINIYKKTPGKRVKIHSMLISSFA